MTEILTEEETTVTDLKEENNKDMNQEEKNTEKELQFNGLKSMKSVQEMTDSILLSRYIIFLIKVLAEELVKGRNRDMIRCTLGDETGLVKAFLNDSPALRVGKSVALFDCEARVVKEHIEVQCRGRIDAARREVEKVNDKWNLSDKSWVPVN